MKIKKIVLILIMILVIALLQIKCIAVNETSSIENEQKNQTNNTTNNEVNKENETINEQTNNNSAQQNNNNANNNQEEKKQETKPNNSSNINQNSNVATVEAPKSENANLQSLTVDVEGLSPEFNKDVVDYYLVVSLDVEEIKINAVAEDSKSVVTVSGNKNLIEGENKVQIAVKAENGNTKIYTILVIRSNETDEMNAYLESLTITGYSFYPSFKRNIYNYNLTINDKVTSLEIIAKTEIDGATFEIVGNENLQEGENLIKIIVTARDGQTVREYKINSFISTKKTEEFQMNKKQAYLLIGVLGVAILVTAVLVFKNKKY